MNSYIEHRFVLSRPSGTLDLGCGLYNVPLHRGEVVVLNNRDGRMPDGRPFPPAAYIVEQVVHLIDIRAPGSDDLHRNPVPNTTAKPTVYLRLLDDSGRVIPVPSGPIPGIVVTDPPDPIPAPEPGDTRGTDRDRSDTAL